MSEQASLHLCNLAERFGLKRAREIIAQEKQASAPVVVTPPAPESPAPVVATEPAPTPETPATPAAETPTPAPVEMTREQIDEGAKNATVAQLKAALDQVGIQYAPNAKKADLLAAFLARP